MSYCKMFELDHTGPDAACIPILQKNVSVEIPTECSFEFGTMLELHYYLLEYVFKFLHASDLHSASSVTPTWDSLAKRELQKRMSPTWVTCSYNPSLCLIHTGPGFKYYDTAICIIAYCPKTIKLDKFVCLHNDDIQRMTFADYIAKEVVADKNDYCTISCTEISPSNIENKNAKVLYQGIFIPYIPKIRTAMFYCNPKKIDQLPHFINDNEQVKCVLVFTQRYRLNLAELFFAELLKGQHSKTVAMGGGLIKGTKTFQKKNVQRLFRAEDLFCIAFLEEDGVEADFNAHSVVIVSEKDEDIDVNYQPFEAAVVKFKENAVLRRCGIIFRFCCFAKSFKDGETAIIEKHFPQYPLLGMEVDGEIGWNSSNEPAKCKRFKVIVPQTLHGWSTVLVLITWGKEL